MVKKVEQPDLLYVPQLAKKLDRTESAIRQGVARGVDWLPPRVDMGKRLAWRRHVVERWLEEREEKAANDDGRGGAQR